METPIPPIRKQKAYLLIVEAFVGLIAEGKLEYGHRLYNEAELMKTLSVSRSTLREALRVMEFLGIVTVRPRKGIKINDPDATNGYPPLMYMLMFQRITSLELFEIRRALLVETARHAAEFRTEADVAILRNINDTMRDNMRTDYVTFSRFDYDFHLHLVRCSGNRLGLKLMQTFSLMLEEQLRIAIRDFPTEQRTIIIDFHTAIFEAVAAKDGAGAQRLMAEHLEKPYKTLRNATTTYTFPTSRLHSVFGLVQSAKEKHGIGTAPAKVSS